MVDASFYFGQGEDPETEGEDLVTRSILNHASLVVGLEAKKAEFAAPSPIDGEVETGDYVKTLHFKRAVYGRVLGVRVRRAGLKINKRVDITGRTQPGAPLQRFNNIDPENLEIHFKAGTLPPDLVSHYE